MLTCMSQGFSNSCCHCVGLRNLLALQHPRDDQLKFSRLQGLSNFLVNRFFWLLAQGKSQLNFCRVRISYTKHHQLGFFCGLLQGRMGTLLYSFIPDGDFQRFYSIFVDTTCYLWLLLLAKRLSWHARHLCHHDIWSLALQAKPTLLGLFHHRPRGQHLPISTFLIALTPNYIFAHFFHVIFVLF